MGCSPPQARLLFVTVLIAVSGSPAARAQRAAAPKLQTPASAQGSLTVTATVVSSVGVMIGPDGQPIMIVANAPSPGDILTASVDGSQRSMVARTKRFVSDPARFRRSRAIPAIYFPSGPPSSLVTKK